MNAIDRVLESALAAAPETGVDVVAALSRALRSGTLGAFLEDVIERAAGLPAPLAVGLRQGLADAAQRGWCREMTSEIKESRSGLDALLVRLAVRAARSGLSSPPAPPSGAEVADAYRQFAHVLLERGGETSPGMGTWLEDLDRLDAWRRAAA